MKRSDSTTPRVAQWPPPAPQVASAIFAATIQGRVTEEEIDAVEGLPPSKFPPELMVKLGFSPPGTPPRPPVRISELTAAACIEEITESMKTENLTKACNSFALFFAEIREAHTDAVKSENQFAEIALFALIEQAAALQTKLDRVRDAAAV